MQVIPPMSKMPTMYIVYLIVLTQKLAYVLH